MSAYLAGQASTDVRRVLVRSRLESGRVARARATMLKVRAPLAARLGAPRPFSYFVGELPAGTDPCHGVTVVGRTEGESYRHELPRAGFLPGSLPLPGSEECKLEVARDLLTAALDRLTVSLGLDGLLYGTST